MGAATALSRTFCQAALMSHAVRGAEDLTYILQMYVASRTLWGKV
jgi:hypothetical protein